MSAEQTIRDAATIDQFLKNEVVAGALQRMERRFYEEFIAAESAEQRVRAWAKASVLRQFDTEMLAVLGKGETEVILAAKAAAKQHKE